MKQRASPGSISIETPFRLSRTSGANPRKPVSGSFQPSWSGPVEAGSDLQAAVVFGDGLYGHPDGGNVDLLGVAIVLRVLVPGSLGPDLVGQLGASVEDAVDGDFGSTEEVLREGEEGWMEEDIEHLAADEVAAGAADVMGPAGGFPEVGEPVLEVEVGAGVVDQSL